ncbi:MAG: DNA topoisomerase IV subunit A [Magnetococcales bacterium]|nr:DNA topoisomerase IV subunit A [Magnetococcales bacterium]MBF0157110.1 DNA topoisomerase IV subunit A [Magnetococcales bacterium]
MSDLASGADGRILESPLRGELESRYLAYALSTIVSRSLPDVRDGLKPVHRRILFAMRALHLDPEGAYKKSARVVGDVIGKFHPHGDQAAYDAMVRLAQEFAARYPLVDGQGNFGNIDGDGAAAMRYTEARLTRVAQALLEGLDQETVDFIPTYDGSQEEPQVLPARFPNLLANGSTGIAVGMSTAIPPHNVGELLEAALLLVERPEATLAEILRVLPGPDFPTGGVLVAEAAEREEVYRSGRGSLRLRARWNQEMLPRGMWQLVVTEIPYQVPKARLIERIAQLIVGRKCPFLEDVRDESDTLLRIVLEPRSNRLDPELIMAYLFRHTDLEVRVTVNLNVITAETRPEVMDLKGLLVSWLAHRFEVLTRRSRYELGRIGERLHLLAAYLIAHLNIDEVIAIIKAHDEPAPLLMARFGLDREQAEAVLNLRLRSLRRLEEVEIRREMATKEARAEELRAILADPGKMWGVVREELVATRAEFADPRRTGLALPVPEIVLRPEDLVRREAVTLILSQMGWVKTVKGHDEGLEEKVRFKEADGLQQAIRTYTNETVSFVVASGKVYAQLVDRFASGKGFGEPLTASFDIDDGERVVWALAVDAEAEYFVTTVLGQGFRIRGADLMASQRKGKQLVIFRPGDRLLHVHPVRGDRVAAISRGRRLLVCSLAAFPLMARGKGVRIMRLRRGEELVDLTTFGQEAKVTLDSGKRQRELEDLSLWVGDRASGGAMLPHGFLSGAVFAGTGIKPVWAAKGETGTLFP